MSEEVAIIRIREIPEVRDFLKRLYSREVRIEGATCEGMSVSTQALILGMAMGMEHRIVELEGRLRR